MENENRFDELVKALVKISDADEMARFLKDLCTPQELSSLSERWHICKLLHRGHLSYREIAAQSGVSLATITRVARFLKDEPYKGYESVLRKIKI